MKLYIYTIHVIDPIVLLEEGIQEACYIDILTLKPIPTGSIKLEDIYPYLDEITPKYKELIGEYKHEDFEYKCELKEEVDAQWEE